MFTAFSYFDKDGSGYITLDELQQACDEFGIENAQLEEMIREADQNNVIPSSSVMKISPNLEVGSHGANFIYDLPAGWTDRL